ncbi:MAG: VWD domain-containing protein [Cetobacterium sp.]
MCTKKECYGTCTIYGEGHIKTFDGKRYSFHRHCNHTLAHVCAQWWTVTTFFFFFCYCT